MKRTVKGWSVLWGDTGTLLLSYTRYTRSLVARSVSDNFSGNIPTVVRVTVTYNDGRKPKRPTKKRGGAR